MIPDYVSSYPFEYAYYIEKIEFKINFVFQKYSWFSWTTEAQHIYTFGNGGLYDVASITLESGTSPS